MTRKSVPPPNDREQGLELFQAVVEAATDAMFVKDRRGQYLMINSACARFIGKSVAEVVGKDDSAFFSPETVAAIAQTDRKIMATQSTETHEEVVTLAGNTRMYLTTKAPYRDAAGKVVGVIGIAREITERKALEAERDRLFERPRLQIDRLPLAYVLMDAKHRVLDWNPAAEKVFGYAKEEALGKVCFELIQSRPQSRIRAMIRRVERGDMDAHTVNQNRTKDGRTVTCEWFNTPLMDSDGKFVGIISLAQDVTERQRFHRKQERLHREASASRNRLRDLSRQLLEAQEIERRSVARELHDEIGQILTAVTFSLKRAKSASAVVTERRIDESLETVQQAIQRVRDISIDLHPPVLDELGLVAALRWYLERQQEGTTCQIAFAAPPSEIAVPPVITGAGFRIVQEAVTNVLRHADAEHVWVELGWSAEGLQITVRDDGVGFDPPEVRRRLVAGRSFGVFGMQARVALLGGRFEINSAPQRGTELRVRLPAPRQSDEPQPRG